MNTLVITGADGKPKIYNLESPDGTKSSEPDSVFQYINNGKEPPKLVMVGPSSGNTIAAGQTDAATNPAPAQQNSQPTNAYTYQASPNMFGGYMGYMPLGCDPASYLMADLPFGPGLCSGPQPCQTGQNSQETKPNQSSEGGCRDKSGSCMENATAEQKQALKNFLANVDNKTFNGKNFCEDPKLSGAITAQQDLDEVGIGRTVKILADGTTVEITEDKKAGSFVDNLVGDRPGWMNRLTGGIEAVAGSAIAIMTAWTGIGLIGGGAMAIDGLRKVKNSFTSDNYAYKAKITWPNNAGYKMITNTDREAFYTELYQQLNILKK